jgi:hypothetical protein
LTLLGYENFLEEAAESAFQGKDVAASVLADNIENVCGLRWWRQRHGSNQRRCSGSMLGWNFAVAVASSLRS